MAKKQSTRPDPPPGPDDEDERGSWHLRSAGSWLFAILLWVCGVGGMALFARDGVEVLWANTRGIHGTVTIEKCAHTRSYAICYGPFASTDGSVTLKRLELRTFTHDQPGRKERTALISRSYTHAWASDVKPAEQFIPVAPFAFLALVQTIWMLASLRARKRRKREIAAAIAAKAAAASAAAAAAAAATAQARAEARGHNRIEPPAPEAPGPPRTYPPGPGYVPPPATPAYPAAPAAGPYPPVPAAGPPPQGPPPAFPPAVGRPRPSGPGRVYPSTVSREQPADEYHFDPRRVDFREAPANGASPNGGPVGEEADSGGWQDRPGTPLPRRPARETPEHG